MPPISVGTIWEKLDMPAQSNVACIASFVLTFIMDFLVPMPMFFSHYVFSKVFFTGWVVISFIWVFVSTAISVVLPLVETAGFLKQFARDVFGGKKGKA